MDPESIFFSENNVKMLYTLIHQNLETKFNCELPQDIILDGVKQVMVQVFNNRTNFVIINNSMTSQKYNMILNKKVLDISLETLPTMLNYKKSELPLSFRQESSQTGYETNISQQFAELQQERNINSEMNTILASNTFDSMNSNMNMSINQIYNDSLSSTNLQNINDNENKDKDENDIISMLHKEEQPMKSFADTLLEYEVKEQSLENRNNNISDILDKKIQERNTLFNKKKEYDESKHTNIEDTPIEMYKISDNSAKNVPQGSNEMEHPSFKSSLTKQPHIIDYDITSCTPNVPQPTDFSLQTFNISLYAENLNIDSDSQYSLINNSINPSDFTVNCQELFTTQPKQIRNVIVKNVTLSNITPLPYIVLHIPEFPNKNLASHSALQSSICILNYDKELSNNTYFYTNNSNTHLTYSKNELVSLPTNLHVKITNIKGELIWNTAVLGTSSLISLELTKEVPRRNN